MKGQLSLGARAVATEQTTAQIAVMATVEKGKTALVET
jgi:hypothetical protein